MAVFSLVAALLTGLPADAQQSKPAATGKGPYVTDYRTGLAIGGYDPVAYFTQGKPVVGIRRLELHWGGVTWRFVNEGNRAAFQSSPNVYAPRFGGHGALSVARGYGAQGSPLIWTIYKQRLYLFYSPSNRVGWNSNPARFIRDADRLWPRLARTLTR